MIEIRSLRDLLRLLFIYQREFKLAALSAVVIIVLGAFLCRPSTSPTHACWSSRVVTRPCRSRSATARHW